MGCLSFFCGGPTDLSQPQRAYPPLSRIEKGHINDLDSVRSISHHDPVDIPFISERDSILSTVPERDSILSIQDCFTAGLRQKEGELARKPLQHTNAKAVAVPPAVHRDNLVSPSLTRRLRDRRAVTRFVKEPRLPEMLEAHYASGVSVNVETWETCSSSSSHLLDHDTPAIPGSVNRSIPVSRSPDAFRSTECELVYGETGMPGSGRINGMGDCRGGTPNLASSMSVACGDGVHGEFVSLRKASRDASSPAAVHQSRRRLAGQGTASSRRVVGHSEEHEMERNQ